MKIAVIFDASGPMAVREDHLQQLSTACPDAEIRFSEDPAELIEAEFQADVLICWATGGKFSCGDYCRFDQQLKWIHCLSSGTEGLMRDPVSARPGLLVTCSKGIHGVPMANHVMGYMLAFLRRFPELAANQKKHTWVRPMPDEATGKRICIIGMGNIGQEIARVAKTFDMFVTGIRRTQTPVEFVDEIRPTEVLDEVLTEADFTIMLLPINEQTRGFMTTQRFAAMKPGSYFINVGRGQTVDEAALADALRSGHLGGAALDAFEEEPLPEDSPLWDMPNVLITPHLAADTPFYMNRAFALAAKNLMRFQAGQPLLSQVDLNDR